MPERGPGQLSTPIGDGASKLPARRQASCTSSTQTSGVVVASLNALVQRFSKYSDEPAITSHDEAAAPGVAPAPQVAPLADLVSCAR